MLFNSKNFYRRLLSPNKLKFFQRGTKREFFYNGSFHEAMGPVLAMGQFFAVMPVKGVQEESPAQLSFSIWNYRSIFCITVFVAFIFDTILVFRLAIGKQFDFDFAGNIVWYGSIIMSNISFLNLSRKWPNLMCHWRNAENKLAPYTNQVDRGALAYKIKMVTIIFMVLSLAEHLMSINADIQTVRQCPSKTNDSIKDFFYLTKRSFFPTFEFSNWLAAFGKYLSIQSTFLWNFRDLFLMLIGIGLSGLLKQLNAELFPIKGKQKSQLFWSNRRKQYQEICTLISNIDEHISLITVVSFSSNLYTICIQLLKGLNPHPSFIHAAYFYFSFLYLLGRTLSVALFSSEINSESRRLLEVIRCIPTQSWGPESIRFSDDVTKDFVALSGMGFFYLTRKMVLTVAGTIVTYELVLIQFRVAAEKIVSCT